MIKSMTGYGRAVETVNGREFTVELRSVNNRYLDCGVKLPRALSFAEEAVKQVVKNSISRGKVDVFISLRSENGTDAKVTLNIGDATSTLIKTLEYTLYDYNDIPVYNDEIRASTKLIQATLPIRTSKEVPLRIELIGAEQHSESVHVDISPETVTIVGEVDAISGINAITLDKIYVEDLVTGLNGPYSYTIKTPVGVSTQNGVKEAVVTVAVNGTTEGTVTVERVNCEGVADGLRAHVDEPLAVSLWGTEEAVLTMTPEQVLVRVDVSEITEVGVYTLPAIVTLKDVEGVSVRGEYVVTVHVEERPVTLPEEDNGGASLPVDPTL